MRDLFLLALAFLELITSLRPEGGLLSYLFAALRAAAPENGALAELTSSPFLMLALSTPILIRPEAAAHSFRMNVIIPYLPFTAARRSEKALRVLTVLAVLVFAFASVRAVTLFLTDGLHFAGSGYPQVVLLTAFLLRFGLLNLPKEEEILMPEGDPVEEIGEVDKMALYSLSGKTTSIHIDYRHARNTIRQYFGPRLVVKQQGERVLIVLPDTSWIAEISETVKMQQTEIVLRIDVSTPRNLDTIHLEPARLKSGVPTRRAVLPEVKRLIDTEVKPAIRANDAYQALEQHTRDYLLCNSEFTCLNLHTMQKQIRGMENIRQIMDSAADDLVSELVEAEANETYRFYGGLFYCRIYVEEVRLRDRTQEAFQRMRADIQETLTAMREDRQGDINAVANLLKSVENIDLPHVVMKPFLDIALNAPTVGSSQASPLLTGDDPDADEENSGFDWRTQSDIPRTGTGHGDETLFGMNI